MQFPKSLHANGWHSRFPLRRPHPDMPLDAHDAAAEERSPRERRRFHALAAIVAVGALAASVGLEAAGDPRPLDAQLGAAMHKAGDMLKGWQEQLARGLQVSLRAVADGRDTPPQSDNQPDKPKGAGTVMAQAGPASTSATSARFPDEPLRFDVAPRQMQPSR